MTTTPEWYRRRFELAAETGEVTSRDHAAYLLETITEALYDRQTEVTG